MGIPVHITLALLIFNKAPFCKFATIASSRIRSYSESASNLFYIASGPGPPGGCGCDADVGGDFGRSKTDSGLLHRLETRESDPSSKIHRSQRRPRSIDVLACLRLVCRSLQFGYYFQVGKHPRKPAPSETPDTQVHPLRMVYLLILVPSGWIPHQIAHRLF